MCDRGSWHQDVLAEKNFMQPRQTLIATAVFKLVNEGIDDAISTTNDEPAPSVA